MKRLFKARWFALAVIVAVCWWGAAVRAQRMPVDFITVDRERMELTESGSNRLLVSWEFTAETESVRLTQRVKDGAIITVLYEVRLLDRGGSLTTVIPGAVIESGNGDNESTVGATIFFDDEDFLVMRENALMFSMDASDFYIVAAYGTGEVTGRFTKTISGTACIEKPMRRSTRSIEIAVTEVFVYLPSDQDE